MSVCTPVEEQPVQQRAVQPVAENTVLSAPPAAGLRHTAASLAGLMLLWSAIPSLADEPVDAILADTVSGYVQPGYRQLLASTDNLLDTLETACSSPAGDDGPDVSVIAAFDSTVSAWARMEWFRQGPVLSENRVERFLYFPDRKSIGARQVDKALANEMPAVTAPATLAGLSVAMQGIGALERVLFEGAPTLTQASHRCAYASAIAGNLRQIASELDSAWQRGDVPAHFQSPAADNPYFRNDAEALNALLGTLIHGLEAVRDTRIAPFLRDSAKADRPNAAPLRRSGNTLRSLQANVEGLHTLYTASGLARALPGTARWLDERVQFEFRQLTRTAAAFEESNIEAILADDAQRERLVYLRFAAEQLITLLASDYSAAAGLTAGFSFGDGD